MTSYDYSEISERKRKLQDVAPASVHPRRPSSAREKERDGTSRWWNEQSSTGGTL